MLKFKVDEEDESVIHISSESLIIADIYDLQVHFYYAISPSWVKEIYDYLLKEGIGDLE